MRVEINKGDIDDREDAAEYLEYVAEQILAGYWAGDGWDFQENDDDF